MQGTVDGFSYGLVTPLVAYLMACLGGALGLRCTTRSMLVTHSSAARLAGPRVGRDRLRHMDHALRRDDGVHRRGDPDPLRQADDLREPRRRHRSWSASGSSSSATGARNGTALFTGGTITGLGYRLHALSRHGRHAPEREAGVQHRRRWSVSVVIAVVAATAALWAAGQVRGFLRSVGASLVMGLAVSGMHYTGMAALSVHLHDAAEQPRRALARRAARAHADRPARLPLPRRGRRDVRPADGHGETRLDAPSSTSRASRPIRQLHTPAAAPCSRPGREPRPDRGSRTPQNR